MNELRDLLLQTSLIRGGSDRAVGGIQYPELCVGGRLRENNYLVSSEGMRFPPSLSAKTADLPSILKHRVLIESAQMPEIKLQKCHSNYLSSLKTKLFYLLAIIRILLLFATKLLTLHNNSNSNYD